MSGDRLRPITRTAWEQADDLRRHLRLQFNVLSAAPLGVALAPARSHLGVSDTFPLGVLERLLLNQDPLPLIAPPGTAEADYHRPEIARGLRAPGQSRVAGGKERRVIEVRARHTHRAGVLHRQPSALLVATQRTAPVAQRRDHQQLRRPSLPFRQRHSPPLSPRAQASSRTARGSAIGIVWSMDGAGCRVIYQLADDEQTVRVAAIRHRSPLMAPVRVPLDAGKNDRPRREWGRLGQARTATPARRASPA